MLRRPLQLRIWPLSFFHDLAPWATTIAATRAGAMADTTTGSAAIEVRRLVRSIPLEHALPEGHFSWASIQNLALLTSRVCR